jgi:hypothetical protein
VILSAAYVGDINATIRSAFPGSYRYVVGGLVAAGVVSFVAFAAAHIRDRRRLRFGALAAGGGGGAAYVGVFSSGHPGVAGVGALHIVE